MGFWGEKYRQIDRVRERDLDKLAWHISCQSILGLEKAVLFFVTMLSTNAAVELSQPEEYTR